MLLVSGIGFWAAFNLVVLVLTIVLFTILLSKLLLLMRLFVHLLVFLLIELTLSFGTFYRFTFLVFFSVILEFLQTVHEIRE